MKPHTKAPPPTDGLATPLDESDAEAAIDDPAICLERVSWRCGSRQTLELPGPGHHRLAVIEAWLRQT